MKLQLAQYPFLRIAIPLVLGNALALFGLHYAFIIATTTISILFFILYKSTKDPLKKYNLNQYYPIPLFCILLSIGWLGCFISKPSPIDEKYIDKPIFLTVEIENAKHENVTLSTIATSVINGKEEKLSIIFQGNDYSIKPGCIIRCRTTLERILPSSVPYSFDYAKHMQSKGILYRGFVKDDKYIIIDKENNIFTTADNLRKTIINTIFRCGFNDDTANFLITILTGDNQFLEEETKQAFSHSGLAHILAVSGLHITIIFTIISFAFSFLDRLRMKWLRLVVTIALIWAFCFITGLSPSAIRASVMTSFLISALLLLKKHSITNALCASAVITLLFDPLALSDVGFQLSYLSVAGIIILANSLTLGKRFSLKKKITSLFAVSIAAQLGTGFVSIMYFNIFPLSFIIANIIIVPILPFFIIAAILTIILTALGLSFPFLSIAVDSFYWFIKLIADCCSGIDALTIDIWLPTIAAISFTLAVLTIGAWLRNRNVKSFLWISVIFSTIGFADLIYQTAITPKQGYFFSDEYHSTNVIVLNNRQLFIINSKNDSSEMLSFCNKHNHLLCRLGIKQSNFLTKEYNDNHILYKFPFLFINGERFLFVTGNYRRKSVQDKKIHIDYAIITNLFYGSITDIEKTYEIDCYIIPKELYKDKRTEIINELENINRKYIDISKGGKCEKGFS